MGCRSRSLCCTTALLLLLGSQPSSCDLASTIGAINSNTASTVNAINSNTASTVGAINSNSASNAANVASASNNNAATTVSAINNNTANTVAAVDGASANNAAAVAGASNNNAANTVAAVNNNTANTVSAVNNATANNVAAVNSASSNNAANTVSAVNNNTANTVAAVNGASTSNANNIVGAINNSTANTVGAVNNASANNAANTVGAVNNSTANTVGAVNSASTSNANNVVGAINNSTASTVAAVNNATASNTANAVNAINNSTANTVGAVNGASTSNANSIVGAINNSTANTVSAVNSASANNVASIVGAINSNTAATVGAVNDATVASTDSIVAAITASTGSTVSAVNSAAAANAASVVGAINNSTGTAVAAVNNASAVAAARSIPVVALAPATGTAANQAAVSLQSSLYNATNSSISAVFQQGNGSVTNLTLAAQNTVARAGVVALANGQQAVINITQVASVVGGNVTGAIEATARNGTRHPVVFWPAFGTSLLNVTVANNSAANCPRNGSFTVAYGQSQMLNGFAESCIYSLLALQHNRGLNFSNQVGVSTSVRDFGNTTCAPTPYAPLYSVFQGVGYSPGRDFFVACYDWRTSPNVDVGTDGTHLQRAQALVEQAYNNTNGTRVYLHAHSNGAIYALSLLSNTSAAWRQKYVAGFIPIAGNWIGQGLTYSYLLSGQSVLTGAPYPGSARAFASWPSTYLSASFPSQYNQSEYIIVNQGNGNYTPAQSAGFYTDANIPYASDLAPLFQGNMTPSNTSPGTHFYGFYGTGIPTLTGQTYTNLTSGNNLIINTPNITLNGDGRQENLGNFAALAFNRTLSPCYHFELLEVVGIPHLLLPMNPNVLQIVTSILFSDPPAVGCTLAPSAAPTTSVTPSRP